MFVRYQHIQYPDSLHQSDRYRREITFFKMTTIQAILVVPQDPPSLKPFGPDSRA